jgi:hypothetical protein
MTIVASAQAGSRLGGGNHLMSMPLAAMAINSDAFQDLRKGAGQI